MKKTILFVAILSSSLFSYAQNEVKIDLDKSNIKWKGSNAFNFGKHEGTVEFKNGKVILKKDSLIGGVFEVAMNTILPEEGGPDSGLARHLKDEDFFDVTKHPVAKLVITNVQYTNKNSVKIHAKMTIKNITKSIAFRGALKKEVNYLTLKAKLKIDRTRWKVNYGAKGFLKSLKDDVISDAIELDVLITTNTYSSYLLF